MPPHQSELNEAARPGTEPCWKLKSKSWLDRAGETDSSNHRYGNCTCKGIVFAEGRGQDQMMRPGGGIRTDRQPGRRCQRGLVETGRGYWVHGERQSKGGRVWRKSIGLPQWGQRIGWAGRTGEPGDVAVWSAGEAASKRLLRSVFKRARLVGAKKP